MANLEPLKILLVEDDPADQKLIKIFLQNLKVDEELYIVNSAEEALDFLYNRGDYRNVTTQPDLILLDLNMPGMGGREFQRQLQDDRSLKQIPVVILTTSNSERVLSYKLLVMCRNLFYALVNRTS